MYYFKWQNHLCMVDIGEQVKESESQSSFKNASIDKTEEVERIL